MWVFSPQVVPISSFAMSYMFLWMSSVAIGPGFKDILQCCKMLMVLLALLIYLCTHNIDLSLLLRFCPEC